MEIKVILYRIFWKNIFYK